MKHRRLAIIFFLVGAYLLEASIANAATVKLQWDPPTDGLTVGYVVWYGTQPGNYTNQTDVGFVTTYDVAGLAESTKYYFAVQAYNANTAFSPLSLEVSGTTAGTTSGGGETGEGGSGTGGSGGSTTPTPGTLKLQWDPPADSATVGYLVWYGTTSGTYTNQTNVGFVTSTSISGLLDGTKYYFAIQAYNANAALSPMSVEVSGTTSGTSSGGTGSGGTESGGSGSGGSTPPGKGKGKKPKPTSDYIELAVEVVMNDAPRNLKATVLNGKSVRLEWDAAIDSSGTLGYLIEAGTGPGRSDLGVISTSALSLTSPALPNGNYFVRVRGVTAAGPGSISNEVVFQIGSVSQCTTIPASPIFVASTRGKVVTLSWRAGAGEAPNGYVLDVGTAAGRHDIATLQFGPETTTFSSPAPAGSYWFRLTAVNACGASQVAAEASVAVSDAPVAVPSDPAGLSAHVSGRAVTLAWSPALSGADATGYVLEVSDANGAHVGSIETQSLETSYSVDNVPPGQYYVRVRAANSGGASAPSNGVAVAVYP